MHWLTSVLVVSFWLVATFPLDAFAQMDDNTSEGPSHGLATRVARLEAQVEALGAQVEALEGVLAQTDARVEAMETALTQAQTILQFVRVEAGPIDRLAGPHWIIEGANVHVRSGSGSTDDGCAVDDSHCENLTGLGNLVVGYNEPDQSVFPFLRTGSHNLVIGPEHGYSSFGGFVTGRRNRVSGPLSSISGGISNRAIGTFSSVGGGS
ncbi:MAG: hypothetical protein OEY15_07360, partial [Myxococcales bacterium]|nr:hypothetical protein [Myxococcales bacterium]